MSAEPADGAAEHPLDRLACPDCGEVVDETVPACPSCGRKMYVEHPADITPTRHAAESGAEPANHPYPDQQQQE